MRASIRLPCTSPSSSTKPSMLEPTETEGPETLDHAADVLKMLAQRAYDDPQAMHEAPHHTIIGRPDEVKAARHPVLRWTKA